MTISLGRWINKSKVDGVTALEYYFGNIRVARIVSEVRHDNVGDKDHTYKVFCHRVLLPGVGTKDFGFAWTAKEAQRAVEHIIEDWLFETGLADDQWQEDTTPEELGAFTLPDSYVVIESVKAAPKSAIVLPLEGWRREGKPNPAAQNYGSSVAAASGWNLKNAREKQSAKLETFASNTKEKRKASHSQRRSLTKGQ